jgi:hypothetical protein
VLEKRCAEEADDDGLWLSQAAASAAVRGAFETEQAARIAALMRDRYGKPVLAHSRHLPPGLPPPFDRAPRRQRVFTVGPDDSISLRSFGAWE